MKRSSLHPPPFTRSTLSPPPHRAFSLQPRARSERGIALLIVVSLLTVVGIMGVAFAFSMYLETQATRQFVSTNQARYLAEAGISHARAMLDEDRLGSRVDDPTETWAEAPKGSDMDMDGDETLDSRWWLVKDAAKTVIGRYAIQISDESGKANLNAAEADPSGWEPGAIDLTRLLESAGVAKASTVAGAIERYRYGEDERPGVAGVDDDADGAIDEADEYQPLALRGDDRRLEGLEELVAVADLNAEEIQGLSRVATVYSWDANVSVSGKTRVNVNTSTAAELVGVLLEAGVKDPWRAAVNIADYADPDMEISRVTKSSQPLLLSDKGPIGGWAWKSDPIGHYAAEESGAAELSWIAQAPTGTFYIVAQGLDGVKVGDVTIAGALFPSVDDGQLLGAFELSGTLVITVANREAEGVSCAFRGIELVSDGGGGAVTVRGIEAVRFNELMVEPRVDLGVSDSTFDSQGSDWACSEGATVCSNSGTGQGRWAWTSPLVRSGRYYVRVLGSASGQTVGEVQVGGSSELLQDGQVHSSTLAVGSDGKISLTIGKTSAGETYYFHGFSLMAQPDGEYVELINLSDQSVDVSGWTIEGELSGGHQARLPSGSVIAPHGLLVAAVDLDDEQAALENNGIDARSAWDIPDSANAVQLEFPAGSPSPSDDWLKATLPDGSASRLLLRSGTVTVDEVQYALPASAHFQSLEKGDPTLIVDENEDGVDESWYPSLRSYTPGAANDNDGLKEQVGLDVVVHDPAEEINVLNRPLGGVGELAGLASGEAWKPFASSDLAKIVDRFTVQGHRLEAEGHWIGTDGKDAWEEKADGYYLHTDPAKADTIGRWQWVDLLDGSYQLGLYSCRGCTGEQFMIHWQLASGLWTDWSPALSTDAQGRILLGQVTIGGDGTLSGTLTLEAKCASAGGICHLDYVRLDPRLIRLGPVNVNTAPREVLLALPNMTEELADRLIAGRPYGDQEKKARGIGDLLIADVLGESEEKKLSVFRHLAHLLTTRSDVFHVLSAGQSLEDEEGRLGATQRIRAVVQR